MADVSTTTTPLSTGATPAASSNVSPYTNVGSVSSWAQPYVSDMLSGAQQLSDKPYTPYTGELTAGQSGLQTTAFSGIGALTAPSDSYTSPTGTWTSQTAQTYMNPYLESSLNPQLEAAKRTAEEQRIANAGRLTQAGAYGGSRQAIMESEGLRNLNTNLSNITGQGYKSAYDAALQQWNTEEQRKASEAQFGAKYGLEALQAGQGLAKSQADLGAQQRAIESEGLAAKYQQWQNEQQYPYKQLQFQQSMLSGLPLTTSTVSAPQPNTYQQIMGALKGLTTGSQAALDALKTFGIVDKNATVSSALKTGWDWLTNNQANLINNIGTSDLTTSLKSQGLTDAQITNVLAGKTTDGATYDFSSLDQDQAMAAQRAAIDAAVAAAQDNPYAWTGSEQDWADLGITSGWGGGSYDSGFDW